MTGFRMCKLPETLNAGTLPELRNVTIYMQSGGGPS